MTGKTPECTFWVSAAICLFIIIMNPLFTFERFTVVVCKTAQTFSLRCGNDVVNRFTVNTLTHVDCKYQSDGAFHTVSFSFIDERVPGISCLSKLTWPTRPDFSWKSEKAKIAAHLSAGGSVRLKLN